MYNSICFFSLDFLFGYLSSLPRAGYFAPHGVFFMENFWWTAICPPTLGGVVHLGGVLPASSGGRLRLVESGFDFSVRQNKRGLSWFAKINSMV